MQRGRKRQTGRFILKLTVIMLLDVRFGLRELIMDSYKCKTKLHSEATNKSCNDIKSAGWFVRCDRQLRGYCNVIIITELRITCQGSNDIFSGILLLCRN